MRSLFLCGAALAFGLAAPSIPASAQVNCGVQAPCPAHPVGPGPAHAGAPRPGAHYVPGRVYGRGYAPGYYGHGYGNGYNRDAVAAGVAAAAAGALIGGAIASQNAGAGYYDAPPVGDAAASCAQRYRSYDPASGTYAGYDGQRHPCP